MMRLPNRHVGVKNILLLSVAIDHFPGFIKLWPAINHDIPSYIATSLIPCNNVKECRLASPGT
jgi:hypothetical protein